VTLAVLDILDAVASAPEGTPAWGLKLCEQTGLGTGTVYPVLDRLLRARWITDRWEEPPPADRPPRRFYEITGEGRTALNAAMAAQAARRSAWRGTS